MNVSSIKRNVERILKELPPDVELVAAAKTRTPEEILEAVEGGVKIVGENYVQESAEAFAVIGSKVRWHFIGHLQKNKVKKAIELFDMIETIDSDGLVDEIDKRCAAAGKVMPVLVEVNSGREPQKYGVLPEDVRKLAEKLAGYPNIKVSGLMTMGPFAGDPEAARPYFMETRKIFDDLKADPVPGTEMRYLSMGMTNSYRVAIEEGANMVRIGTKIFGERE
ncbi:MAG: YggS family pyridoxal phosphate-dependent enzyme [Candidatus Omnitrophota bacterium]